MLLARTSTKEAAPALQFCKAGGWPTQARFWLEWGCSHPTHLLLAYFLDALFQNVEGDVGFFFGHHQRRAQAD
jgi:hypothetical protein